jgi:hypothetical protein
MHLTRILTATLIGLCAAVASADITNITQGTTHPTIQDAINQAVDGDEIVLDPGEYFENINMLSKAITLRSQDPTDASIVRTTIINGSNSPAESIITCTSNEGADTVISGLTLKDGGSFNVLAGGGINMDESSPTITHCHFLGCTALNGGAIFVFDGSPTISDCTFQDNLGATVGSGIYLLANVQVDVLVERCRFIRCGTRRAIVANGELVNLTVQACEFIDNSATSTMLVTQGSAIVSDSTFIGSNASQTGAGLQARASGEATLRRCVFIGNTAGGTSGVAGALEASSDSSITIIDCEIIGNEAVDGGAIFSDDTSTVTVSGSRIWGNSAEQIVGGFTDDGDNFISELVPPPGTVADLGCAEDVTGDGVVDQADLGALLAAYGEACQ